LYSSRFYNRRSYLDLISARQDFIQSLLEDGLPVPEPNSIPTTTTSYPTNNFIYKTGPSQIRIFQFHRMAIRGFSIISTWLVHHLFLSKNTHLTIVNQNIIGGILIRRSFPGQLYHRSSWSASTLYRDINV